MMLATASLGAVFSSTSPDFGVDGVIDRFGQIEPKILVATTGYRYGGSAFDCLERLGEIHKTHLARRHLDRDLGKIANHAFNIAADIGAMGAALELLIGGNAHWYGATFGILSVVLQVFIPFPKYAPILKALTLALLAYVASLFVIQIPWGEVAYGTLLPELSPNIGLHPQSTPDPLYEYLEGLRRLAAYDPRLILPAHGRPFADAPTRVTALLAHHKRRLEQISAMVGNGEKSAWAVATELWGSRDNPYEKRAALQEGLAHLQALAVEGRVKKFVTPTSIRWSAIPAGSPPPT